MCPTDRGYFKPYVSMKNKNRNNFDFHLRKGAGTLKRISNDFLFERDIQVKKRDPVK